MRLFLLFLAVVGVAYGQGAKASGSASVDASAAALPSPPQNQPQKEKQSSAALSGSEKVGQKGGIDANFGGLTIAKKDGGKQPQKANVGHDGNGAASAVAGNGASFVAKKNAKAEGKPDSATYGADKLPGGAPAFGSSDLDKTKNIAHGSFNGGKQKTEQQSQVDWAKAGSGDQTANLKGGAKGAVVKDIGKDDKFTFDGAQGKNKFVVDPSKQDKEKGDGTIVSQSEKGKGDGQYKYTVNGAPAPAKGKDAQSTARLSDAAPVAGRSAFDWTCTGSNNGASSCTNAKGETVGKALKDDQGNVVIYDLKGNVVGRSDVEKGKGPKEYNVNVGQAAVKSGSKASDSAPYLVSVDNWTERDCYKDVAKKDNPYKDAIKVKKPYKFIYNQKAPNTYNYPDCFKIVGNVYLAKGVDVKQLAVEFRVRINPLGDLKCTDPGSCGRECYYCDICKGDSIRWKVANTNTDTKDTCARSGNGDWYELTATVCPPPPTDTPVCSSFERSFSSDYWTAKKQDTLQATLLFWKRPTAITELENNFFYRLKNEGASFRSSVKSQATLSGVLAGKGASGELSDFELKEAYVRGQLLSFNQTYKEELLYCDQSTTDYNVGGSKVGAKYLAGAADVLQKNGTVASSVYSKPVCKDVSALQQQEMDNLKDKWTKAGEPKGSNGALLSGVGNLLGGGAKGGKPVFGGL